MPKKNKKKSKNKKKIRKFSIKKRKKITESYQKIYMK